MTRLDEINELFRYNAWAMRRIFDATAVLSETEFTKDMGNSFPSIRDTLMHIVGGEWVWLERWLGVSPTGFPMADTALLHGQIREWWEEVNAGRVAYLATLSEDALDSVVEYDSFAGVHFAFPLWQMLRHIGNHSTYHRGQVTTMLKQLGHKPVSTDMILLYQEEYKARLALNA
jgi:uncharacterized damage-inducible protein DinB